MSDFSPKLATFCMSFVKTYTQRKTTSKNNLVLMIITHWVGSWGKFFLLRLLLQLGPTPLSSLTKTTQCISDSSHQEERLVSWEKRMAT